jgi:vacuolar-type H+-ATPase subunit F/Vma7
MGQLAVIGEAVRTRGFGLAGAVVIETDDDAGVLEAWDRLGPEVTAAILTPEAARALGRHRFAEGRPWSVVMPS